MVRNDIWTWVKLIWCIEETGCSAAEPCLSLCHTWILTLSRLQVVCKYFKSSISTFNFWRPEAPSLSVITAQTWVCIVNAWKHNSSRVRVARVQALLFLDSRVYRQSNSLDFDMHVMCTSELSSYGRRRTMVTTWALSSPSLPLCFSIFNIFSWVIFILFF